MEAYNNNPLTSVSVIIYFTNLKKKVGNNFQTTTTSSSQWLCCESDEVQQKDQIGREKKIKLFSYLLRKFKPLQVKERNGVDFNGKRRKQKKIT